MKKQLSRLLLAVLCLMCSIGTEAALTTGYYTLKNVGYGNYMYEDFTSSCVRATSSAYSDGDYEKVWKITVSGSNITMQNVYTGHYIQAASGYSTVLSTGSTAATFALTTKDDGSYMIDKYFHNDGSNNIVEWWDTNSNYSKWTIESVSLTDAQVAAAQTEYNATATINSNRSTYNTALAKFFTDLSCSELNSTYSSYTAANLKTAMAGEGLPTSIQNAGVSVLNQWSSETDPAIVKQFRVQTYKPYSRAYYARNKLNATQFNDMCNPTGIIAGAKSDLLVFVDGAIPDGCTLRLAAGTGNNRLSYTSGTELQQGVNAVKCASDLTQFWIMYTYTSDTQVDLSTLSKLKIHIEGGTVLGYVDAGNEQTIDQVNTEYKKILDHANTVTTASSIDDGNVNFVVKGNRGVFFFPLDTYNTIWAGTNYGSNTYDTYHIGNSIYFFDSVLKWEWSLMGFMQRVVDGDCDPAQHSDTHENLTGGNGLYPTYYNNLALTLQEASGQNPYSTEGYTSMPGVGGVESSYNAERVNFDNWCVGHESGHNNQGLINLPSSTESSNNLFSNVIQYQWGYRMSRGASIANANSDFVNGTQFALRDIGETHRMYWQLYLYYHQAKNNTAFYPTFFNLLRSDNNDLSKGTCFTKFYEKACEAAGQDLTSFFTVWGFLQPFENTTFGDYTTRVLTLTQDEIDAAIARVKAKVADGTYKSDNLDIMFIEDRTETAYRWDINAENTTTLKVSSDGNAVTAASLANSYGTTGSISSMTSGSTSSTTGSYVYSIENGKLVLDGTSAGAGVIVYDTDGNIIAFGNSSPITIPSAVSDYGQITVKAVATDGTVTEAESVIESGTDAQKLETLQAQIDAASKITALADDTEKKVGYYKSSYLTDLISLVEQANTAISNSATSSYSSLITSLTEEIARVKAIDDLTIKIVAGNSYSIRNGAYPARYASVSSNKLVTSTNTTLTDAEKWQFVPTGSSYYIYNVGSQTYASYSATSTQVQANATSTDGTATSSSTDVAYTYSIVSNGDGTFYLQANEAGGYKCWHSASNASYNIVGWTAGADASKWYVTLEDESESGAAMSQLQSLVSQTQSLVDKAAASYSFAAGTSAAETLQTTSSTTSFYLTTNHQETTSGCEIANLLDNNTSTIFHSTWSTATTDKHYLQIDCVDQTLTYFTFNFISRNISNNNCPKSITVMGSNDGSNYTEITTDVNSLATSGSNAYTSPVIGNGISYRYIRFVVNSTGSGNGTNTKSTYPFFSLAEFGISSVTRTFSMTANDGFSSVTTSKVQAAVENIQKSNSLIGTSTVTVSELTAEYTALKSAYDALKSEVDAAEKDPYKAQLQTLISNTNTLLSSVSTGTTINDGTSTKIELTSSMLSSNHDESTLTGEGSLANLLDNDNTTIFHSAWSVDYDDAHYWQVELPEDDAVGLFNFSYTTRKDNSNKAPIDITISGSNDGTNFTTITELTSSSANPLPSATSGANTYTSSTIGNAGTTYRYIRFTVNKTNCNTEYFCLSEFSMNSVCARTYGGTKTTGYTEIGDNLLIDAIDNVTNATSMISDANYPTASANALKYQVTALQNAYDALYAAKKAIDDASSTTMDVTGKIVASATAVTDLSTISDSKYYALYNVGRGVYVIENDSKLYQQTYSPVTDVTDSDIKMLVQFTKNGDTYTIKNPVTGNYYGTIYGSTQVNAVAEASAANMNVVETNTTNHYFSIQDATSTYMLDGNGSGKSAVGWNTDTSSADANGQYIIYEVTLADYASVSLKYVLSTDPSTAIKTEAKKVKTGDIPTAPSMEFATCAVTPQEAAAADKEYTVTVTENLPFQKSTGFDNAIWHTMDIHSYNGRHVWTYTAENADITLSTTESLDDMTQTQLGDSKQWCFVGNVIEGFNIYNKAAGSTMKLYKASTGQTKSCMSSTNGTKFFLVQTNTTYRINGGFCLLAEGDTHYLNHQNGVINGWGDNDAGSTCRAFLSIESAWTQAVATAETNNTAEADWVNAVGYTEESAHTTMVNAYTEYKDVASTACTYAQLTALKAANEAYANAAIIMPTAGKYYRLHQTEQGWYAYSNTDNQLMGSKSQAGVKSIFRFEDAGDGNYYLKACNNKYIQVATKSTQVTLGDDKVAYSVTMPSGETSHRMCLRAASSTDAQQYLHCNSTGTDDHSVVGWGTTETSRWKLEDVTDYICYDVTTTSPTSDEVSLIVADTEYTGNTTTLTTGCFYGKTSAAAESDFTATGVLGYQPEITVDETAKMISLSYVDARLTVDTSNKFVDSKTQVTSLDDISSSKIYALYNVGRACYDYVSSDCLKQEGNDTDNTYIDNLKTTGINFLFQVMKMGTKYVIRDISTGKLMGGMSANNSQPQFYDETGSYVQFNIGVASSDNNSFYIQDSNSSILLNGQGSGNTGNGNGYNAVGWGNSTTSVAVNSQIQIYEIDLGTFGDANNDRNVSVSDLSTVVSYILDSTNTTDINITAADANQDNSISVSDLSTIVSEILGTSDARSAAAHDTGINTVTCKTLNIKAGEDALLYVNIDNNIDVAAFQFDALLPDGFTCEDVSADYDRVCDDASLNYAVQKNGEMRVLCYSMSNGTVSGNSGSVAILKIHADSNLSEGSYKGQLQNIELAEGSRAMKIANAPIQITVGSATGIGGLDAAENRSGSVYDLNGRLQNRSNTKSGVYISNNKKYIQR